MVSTVRKIGAMTRAVGQQANRNRTLGAVMKAVGATARSFGRVAHQLWLEVTGAVFLAMAAFGGIALAREWVKYHAGHTTSGRVAIAICFTLVFSWFGVSSFWRVSKSNSKQRS